MRQHIARTAGVATGAFAIGTAGFSASAWAGLILVLAVAISLIVVIVAVTIVYVAQNSNSGAEGAAGALASVIRAIFRPRSER